MRVIVIGSDLTGKSTLIENLQKIFSPHINNLTHVYITKKTGKELIEDTNFYITNGFDELDPFIFDRFHYPDNPVYERVFHPNNPQSALIGYEESVDSAMRKKDVIFIYLEAPLNVLMKRYDERGDDLINKEDLIRIKREYERFLEKTTIPVFRFDTSTMGIEKLAFEVANVILGYYDYDIILNYEE